MFTAPQQGDVREIYDPRTNQILLVRRRQPNTSLRVGVDPQPTPKQPESFTLADLGAALKKITPSLLLIGIATGAAFAIGSGLVSRLVFKDRR